MTKKSLIVREIHKSTLIKKFAARRNALRAIINDRNVDPRAKLMAQFKMQKLPIRSLPIRAQTRCMMTGRPRAVLKKFGLSRLAFREEALLGHIPGVKKASW